jgi:hypothetical protein
MTNNPKKQTSPVRRITIDERLADGLIRILIANLKDGVATFSDDSKYWEEEKDLLVRPDDYRKKMGMTRANVKKWPWDNLYEGQVFLQGRFRGSRNRRAKGIFVTDIKRRSFQRIDHLSKGRIKNVYLTALERSIPHGETNRTK